ncbi:MAG: hypothetical protein ACTSSF_07940, partial [Candidatus Heimdallarchaeaceae archaeon]
MPSSYIFSRTKIKASDLESIRKKLGFSISCLPNLSRKTLEHCYKMGFSTISKALIYYQELEKSVQSEILVNMKYIKTLEEITFTEPLSEINTYLHTLGYDSYKSFISSSLLWKDKTVFKKLGKYLLANIRFLELDEKVERKLKNA